MKKTKKKFISLAAGILATTSAANLVTNIAQVHAAQTTEQNQNTEEGTLILNHNTRVYNKKGQKVYSYLRSNGLFKKGATVKYADQIKKTDNPDNQRYSFHDTDWNWFYLPYKTIKGKEYYNIGHGGYIKAINVEKVDNNYLYTNEISVKLTEKAPVIQVVNGKAKMTGKSVNAGQAVTLNGKTSDFELFGVHEDGDSDSSDYMIKNTDDEFIRLNNGTLRKELLPYSNFMNVVLTDNSYLYTEKGEKYIHHNSANEIIINNKTNVDSSVSPQLKKGSIEQVIKAIYLWVAEDRQVELFYQLKNNVLYPEDKAAVFIKAASSKYIYGSQVKPSNTKQDVIR